MLKRITSLFLILLVASLTLNAQDARRRAEANKAVAKVKAQDPAPAQVVNRPVASTPVAPSAPIVNKTSVANFTIQVLGAKSDYYDLQSNGTPQQIIQDPANPASIHITFCTGNTVKPSYTDRGGIYLFSDNFGSTFSNFGRLTTARGGFPSISLMGDGRAVISQHSTAGGASTQVQTFFDNSPGEGSFATFKNAGATPAGDLPIWARTLGLGEKVLVCASVSGGDSAFVNLFDGTAFAGYKGYSGDQGEAYQIAKSADGQVIGHVYGGDGTTDEANNVYYRESSDGGLTWSERVTIWEWRDADSMGVNTGMSLTFIDHTPQVAFDIIKNTKANSYYPSFPSKIAYWSPEVNNGVPVVVADSHKVMWFSNPGSNGKPSGHTPICRPSIGAASDGRALMIAFEATHGYISGQDTIQYLNETDTIAYYATFAVFSTDKGATWTDPVKITPQTSPMKDWRFVNVAPFNTVIEGTDTVAFHLVAQTRDTAGIYVNEGPAGAPAKPTYVQARIYAPISGIAKTVNPAGFELTQNYPNPFNPATSINYTVPSRSNVNIRVYDVLGRQVASLVNEVKEAGSYRVSFNAANLPSGAYIYKINAGSFSAARKMILAK